MLGTLQYMAPEQLEGKEVDSRTDIFAFGALVYEMATGQKAFQGDSQASLIGAILKDEPAPVSTIQPMTPAALDYVVKTCLAKAPDDRWQGAGDLGRLVKGIVEGGLQPSVAVPVSPAPHTAGWRRAVIASLATLVVGGIIVGLAVWSLMRSPAPRLERFAISPPPPLALGISAGRRDIAISPDGTRAVYTATGGNPLQLHVRAVGELVATPLRVPGASPYNPFVSPDSAWVGFFDFTGNILKKVSILGGPAVTICSVGANFLGASWGEEDTIIFGNETPSGLWRVSSNGGEPEELTTADAERGRVNHGWPHILPGGRAVLFTILTDGPIDNAQIAVLNLGLSGFPNKTRGSSGVCRG